MVRPICLERDADLHTARLMPLPLTVSCFSKIQIGFTFLVPAHPGSPGKRAVKRVCVCVCATDLDVVWVASSREPGEPRIRREGRIPQTERGNTGGQTFSLLLLTYLLLLFSFSVLPFLVVVSVR